MHTPLTGTFRVKQPGERRQMSRFFANVLAGVDDQRVFGRLDNEAFDIGQFPHLVFEKRLFVRRQSRR